MTADYIRNEADAKVERWARVARNVPVQLSGALGLRGGGKDRTQNFPRKTVNNYNAKNDPNQVGQAPTTQQKGGINYRGKHRGVQNAIKNGWISLPQPGTPSTNPNPSTPAQVNNPPSIVLTSIYNWAVVSDTFIPPKAVVSPFTGLPLPAGTNMRAMSAGDAVAIANHNFAFMPNHQVR